MRATGYWTGIPTAAAPSGRPRSAAGIFAAHDSGPRMTVEGRAAQDPDRRAEVLAAIAQRNAAEMVRLARENADLRARLGAELVHAEAQVRAVTDELDRLRSIPELRVGQRLRQLAHAVPSRSAPDGPAGRPPADAAPAHDGGAAGPDVVDAAGETGLGYADPPPPAVIVLLRNRRRGVEPLRGWLAEQGVHHVELVDNASSDPATVELLAGASEPVHRVDDDLGELAPWVLGVAARLLADGPVLFVDGDTIPSATCPADALARLHHELHRHADRDAVELPSTEEDGGNGRRPLCRLVRSGTAERPVTAFALPPPYAVRCASWDAAADDPDERYARLCDAA